MKMMIVVLCVILAGCTTQPTEKFSEYGTCLIQVKEDGSAWKERCVAWHFGPTKFQQAQFDYYRAHRLWP